VFVHCTADAGDTQSQQSHAVRRLVYVVEYRQTLGRTGGRSTQWTPPTGEHDTK
jgi:hypothetical protein